MLEEVFLVSPYLVNGCTGKMGKAVVEAAVSAGIRIVPVSFGGLKNAGKTVQVGGKDIQMYGPYERERILASTLNDYPNLIVVDYTVPVAVNGQSHRFKAFRIISLIQCRAGSSASCSDSSNLKSLPQVKKIRDPKQQIEMVGVPKEYLSGHAFHMYHLESPDKTISFEFQHNVCGRSIYAEGTVDAAIFLAKKVIMLASSKCTARVQSKADKFIYSMIDVLREGAMR
ncbi:unnamed protein product [Ilex paraguariensis]|uniref:Uncharacterized protein n=1 Tax=Ilex paraguariensis TaxID=185542 RepID=A0ABC8V427_9AQUA